MSVYESHIELEQTVSELINQSGYSMFHRDYASVIARILLQEYADLGGVEAAEFESIFRDVIDELMIREKTRVEQIIEQLLVNTRSFYDLLGVPIPTLAEAVRRSEQYAQLSGLYLDNMQRQNDDLVQATIKAVAEESAKGNFDQTRLADQIYLKSEGPYHHAATNARMLVGGYNRVYRQKIADKLGLEWALYYGDRRESTRPFCSTLIDTVCHKKHISLLDNGQGLPVETFCGGYNCIHSWMYVRLKWDKEYSKRIHMDSIQYVKTKK